MSKGICFGDFCKVMRKKEVLLRRRTNKQRHIFPTLITLSCWLCVFREETKVLLCLWYTDRKSVAQCWSWSANSACVLCDVFCPLCSRDERKADFQVTVSARVDKSGNCSINTGVVIGSDTNECAPPNEIVRQLEFRITHTFRPKLCFQYITRRNYQTYTHAYAHAYMSIRTYTHTHTTGEFL